MSGSLILTAKLDQAALADFEGRLASIRDGKARALSLAVNKVMPGVRKDIIAAVREKAPIKVSALRKAGGYTRASVQKPWAKTWLAGYPLAISYFPFTPRTNFPYTRRGRSRRPAVGVSVLLDNANKARVFPGTFVVARANTWRFSDGSKYEVVERVGLDRFPIRIVHGLTPGEILAGDELRVEGLVKRARERFLARTYHEIEFLFRKTGLYGVETKEKDA